MLISINDFLVEANIPLMNPTGEFTMASGVEMERVQSFIDKYEPRFLYKFFGCNTEKVNEYLDYYTSGREDDNVKTQVISQLKSSIVNYVAYYYFRSETIMNTSIGGVVPQGENGKKSSNIDRCTLLWNQMAEQNIYVYTAVLNESCPKTEVFKFINSMNL